MNIANLFMSPLAWDVGTFLKNATTTLQFWGGLFISLLGVVLIVYAVVMIVKYFTSKGQSQDGPLKIFFCILIGGALLGGGWKLISEIAKGGEKSIRDMGSGSGGIVMPVGPIIE